MKKLFEGKMDCHKNQRFPRNFPFAECTRHTRQSATNRSVTPRLTYSVGFTLVGVLITLSIIGVVAIMTIPNLVSNYQKMVWTAQFQKSYATLEQGFRRMLEDDKAIALSQTKTFNSIGENVDNDSNGVSYKFCNYYSTALDGTECKDFLTNLGRYFKISSIQKYTDSNNYNLYCLNGNDHYHPYNGTVITLNDGTMIFNFLFTSQDPDNRTNNQMKGLVGHFYMDVNGTKLPNIWGRDIFSFYLGDNGIVYPYGALEVHEYTSDGPADTVVPYWRDSSDCNLAGNGFSCATRVLEEGKMNY